LIKGTPLPMTGGFRCGIRVRPYDANHNGETKQLPHRAHAAAPGEW
jgi:hypothetical protein